MIVKTFWNQGNITSEQTAVWQPNHIWVGLQKNRVFAQIRFLNPYFMVTFGVSPISYKPTWYWLPQPYPSGTGSWSSGLGACSTFGAWDGGADSSAACAARFRGFGFGFLASLVKDKVGDDDAKPPKFCTSKINEHFGFALGIKT